MSLLMQRLIYLLVSTSLFFSCSKPTRFERLDAGDTGIDFVNLVEEKDSFNILHDEYMYNGGGVGAGDLNNDGRTDLVFTGNKVSSRIYLNKGDFEFKDITDRFPGLDASQWYSGVSLVDLNADGFLDMYLTSTSAKDPAKRKNKLWISKGIDADSVPSYEEVAAQWGVDHDGHTVHAGFFDYDLDGDLDLYLLNNIVNRAVPTNYRDKIVDGSSINNDRLLRNDGNGHFTDVTIEAGIVYEGYGLGLAFGDINKDGYPDIYVSNDYIANDLLYINQKNGTFKNMSSVYLNYQSRFSMGNDMVDMNNDGNLDIMSVDMMPELYARKKQTINGNSYVVYINNEKFGYEPQYVRNMIHYHNGFLNGEMLPFSEVGQITGLYQTEWSWSPLFADYDNDGDRDLLITNGFPKDLTDKDFTNYKAQVYGYVATDEHILPKIPIVKVSNYAFENQGELTFSNKTEEWGLSIPSFSNGAAFVDLDNDGDLDYAVNNINDPAFIYRNNTIGKLKEEVHYLRIKLKGSAPNTQAVGAKVELWAGGQYMYQENFFTRGYISSVEPVVHFGLGKNTAVDSVVVRWPKGTMSTVLKNLKSDQTLIIDESSADKREAGPVIQAKDSPVFERVEAALDYKHTEEDYIDFFQNQRIIQHKFSQIGPCMAQGDLNGDGQEDVLIGGSQKAPAAVFVRLGSGFERKEMKGLTETKGCQEADMKILDLDGDGDNDVVSVAGGYETESDTSYVHYYFINDKGLFRKRKLPLPPFPASVVRFADVDKDGDQDLFIGARVKRMAFPEAPASYILINDRGEFSSKPVALEAGMVTDAVFSDADRDGWVDVMVTREWGSVGLIRNVNGGEFKLETTPDLAGKTGLWSSIASGDFDGDGDDDYMVGNLGDNHRFTVSEQYPLRTYAVDLDKNSFIDPLTTSYWKDEKGEMTEYPVNYLDELAAQSPYFRKKFTSYTSFSRSSLDSILDKSALAPSQIFSVNTTSSHIIWNDGGKFSWEKLPAKAQVAPIRKILVADFNGDNVVDVLLAGNDKSYDVSTGYYLANKGLVMLGQGNRKFKILPPSESGVVLNGMVTSLLYIKGAIPVLIAGVNRDGVVVLRQPSASKAALAEK